MDQPDELIPTSKAGQKGWEAHESMCARLRAMLPHIVWLLYSRVPSALSNNLSPDKFQWSGTWIEKARTAVSLGIRTSASLRFTWLMMIQEWGDLLPGLLYLGRKKLPWRKCPAGGVRGTLSTGASVDPGLLAEGFVGMLCCWLRPAGGLGESGSGTQRESGLHLA